MRRWTWGLLVVAAGVGAWLAVRRPAPQTPEARIRTALERAAQAAGERKADEVIELLSQRFGGEAGGERFTRDDARRLVVLELLRGRWVSASITGAAVVVDGGRAKAVVHVVLSRAGEGTKGLGDLLPGEASAHRFLLDLEEESGEWRVVSARWRQIGLEEALSGPPEPDW
jgi:hypothetical protein